MAVFKYKALNKEGKETEGLVDATNEQEASGLVISKGLKVIFIKAEKTQGTSKNIVITFGSSVKTKDVVIFFRQFAVMVSASVAMVQALKIIVEQTVSVKLKMLISEIADEVDSGSRLSDAMSKHPKVFTPFHTSVIKGGESSGRLAESLTYLADEVEKDYDMVSKIKGAMTYPAFVMTGLLVVGVVMMVFVVPKLTGVLQESGVELPIATKILIGTSNFMQVYWYLIVVSAIGLAFFLKMYMATPSGRYAADFILLKLPIFGNLFQKIYIVRFSRSMETLLSGGVTVVDALKVSGEVVNNRVFTRLIQKTRQEVEDGNPMSTVLSTSKMIPQMVSQMVSIGEKTGKLDMVLGRVAQFYGREVGNSIDNLMVLMEPIIMVVMGLAVGTMVAAIILLMYNIATGT
ncbi:MAG: type II secretion system F family protein [Candidatus Falkowbacteria bacterium]|nr:type II secretion system F family protein [Candidatus Falkowbacteria bacterium]